jgi:hypothetical protein
MEDVILSQHPASWERFFALRGKTQVPEEFMRDRSDAVPQKRDLF